jgi:group II intron reverse transcriptase/maturase
MSLGDIERQTSNGEQLELTWGDRGEALGAQRSAEISKSIQGDESLGSDHLMELVVKDSNVRAAVKRVKKNKGSPGIDGMSVKELEPCLAEQWNVLRQQLLAGNYQPKPVKRVVIPKSDGGVRQLGIPTVVDRFIQQAFLQILQPRFDPTFSNHSHGFRPGRSAHDAVRAACGYIQKGRRWVVDVDLEKFFDRVNHDVLMGRLAKRITDKAMLRIIRRYLEAGLMVNGVVTERWEGTPQGGPLSPLLANVLLDEVDKELEKRGHTFVRYADDCNVYVRSERAAQRVMEALRKMYEKLQLRVNEKKSCIVRVWNAKFLGYSFWVARGGAVKSRVAAKALKAMKERVRELTSRNGGKSLDQVAKNLGGYLRGWKEYFQLAETPGVFRELDEWIRHRMRMIQLKQWKTGPTAYRKLRAKGFSHDAAAMAADFQHSWWHRATTAAHIVMPISYFDTLGVPRLAC